MMTEGYVQIKLREHHWHWVPFRCTRVKSRKLIRDRVMSADSAATDCFVRRPRFLQDAHRRPGREFHRYIKTMLEKRFLFRSDVSLPWRLEKMSCARSLFQSGVRISARQPRCSVSPYLKVKWVIFGHFKEETATSNSALVHISPLMDSVPSSSRTCQWITVAGKLKSGYHICLRLLRHWFITVLRVGKPLFFLTLFLWAYTIIYEFASRVL